MDVVILTQAHCHFCEQGEEILGRLGAEFDLSMHRVELSSPEGRSLAADAGVLFPPGIVVDGDLVSYGRPSERRLRKELERRQRDKAV
ncbi:MAG: thioredoxin family protein [Actinomycetota bacterium]|nr:thioredoxin family protein [Actinomycetota bacterium]